MFSVSKLPIHFGTPKLKTIPKTIVQRGSWETKTYETTIKPSRLTTYDYMVVVMFIKKMSRDIYIYRGREIYIYIHSIPDIWHFLMFYIDVHVVVSLMFCMKLSCWVPAATTPQWPRASRRHIRLPRLEDGEAKGPVLRLLTGTWAAHGERSTNSKGF